MVLVNGVWCMVYGAWCMVHVYDAWCMVSLQRVVNHDITPIQ